MWKQYPPNTETVFSYIESRGGKYDETVFFGLQAFLKEYLSDPITQEMIDEADEFWAAHGEPFNREGWQYILDKYDGYLPLEIRSIPEGMVIKTGNIMVSVENTDPKCFWLTTWLETALLRAIWYPTTVATQSWSIKKLIAEYLEQTSDAGTEGIEFKLHDFGKRGVSSQESAGLGGMAHLVNFMGTDTITGALYAKRYYGAEMAGFSIPAAEHSTITSWGQEGEVDAYRNMLNQFGGEGKVVAVVSDSYDIYNAAAKLWGEVLRQAVIDSGALVVIRPDSGTPWEVVPKLADILGSKFGYTTNSKGYKVLNTVRIIQGDGINLDSISRILSVLKEQGWSAENVAFGMGGALLQQVDRDTQKFAMKCSAIKIDGQWRDVFKDPVTDRSKQSKRGRLDLIKAMECSWQDKGIEQLCRLYKTARFGAGKSLMRTVWNNGKLLVDDSFDKVRKRTTEEHTLSKVA
ncbi:MAG: nicotinate phosphoribosyltransferase [Chromatiales bacterium]|nr:nicotinate phosphoribosyltransferase [Chromatiales bacterium]